VNKDGEIERKEGYSRTFFRLYKWTDFLAGKINMILTQRDGELDGNGFTFLHEGSDNL
jgi:hypothetical protein